MGASFELLEYVVFTQTNQESDTMTVNAELVRDPEHFLNLCMHIAGSTFLRVPSEFDVRSAEDVIMYMPVWFKQNRFNSLASWLLLFIERNIFVHFATFVRNQKSFVQHQDKWFSQAPEGTLFNFRYEIITYWADFTKKLQKQAVEELSQLNLELDQKACSEPVVSPLNGGLFSQSLSQYDLKQALHEFNQRLLALKD